MFLFWLCAEIEAKEACDWLREAGFPQYVHLFRGKYEAARSVTSRWIQMTISGSGLLDRKSVV